MAMQGSGEVAPCVNGSTFVVPPVPPRFPGSSSNLGRFYHEAPPYHQQQQPCPEPVRMAHQLGSLQGFVSPIYSGVNQGRPCLKQWPTPADALAIRPKFRDFWSVDICAPPRPIKPQDHIKIGQGHFLSLTTYRADYLGTCNR